LGATSGLGHSDDMTYVELGEGATREVLVQRYDGTWVSGRLRATKVTEGAWTAQVGYVDTAGNSHLEWVEEGRIAGGRTAGYVTRQ
jgi:hypothetical protein